VLAQKMLTLLDADPHRRRIHLVVSETGLRLFAEGIWQITVGSPKSVDPTHSRRPSQKIDVLATRTLAASIASGSYHVDAMAVIPCPSAHWQKFAAGTCDDLLARSADVMLKEGRKLILCVRDTPFSASI